MKPSRRMPSNDARCVCGTEKSCTHADFLHHLVGPEKWLCCCGERFVYSEQLVRRAR